MHKIFDINGIFGFFLLVVVLLAVVFGLGVQAWKTQKMQATQGYTLDEQAIEVKSSKNIQYYKMKDK